MPMRALRWATLKVPNPTSCGLSFFQAGLDAFDHGVERPLGGRLAGLFAECFLNGFYEFCLIHEVAVFLGLSLSMGWGWRPAKRRE